MRLFPKPLEIGEFEGFTEEKDIFERREFGEGLQRLFERVDEPLTVILDSPWGTGKSTFIEMWCGHMRQQGFPIIHFDAFKHDHVNDAFGALAGEVFAKAEEYYCAVDGKNESLLTDDQKKNLRGRTKTFFNATRRFGKVVLKTGAKGLIKKLGSKALDDDALKELADLFGDFSAELIKDSVENGKEELAGVLEELIDAKFAGRSQQTAVVEDFAGKLSGLACQLKEPAAQFAAAHGYELSYSLEGKRPLIFVIDELDRCKPSFSLQVFELIKHFFAQDNVHFLLVTHMKPLESSVKATYGIDGCEREYLQKFYSLLVTLPEAREGAASKQYGQVLLKSVFREQHESLQSKLSETSEILFSQVLQRFSLRELEKIMAQLRILILTVKRWVIREYPAAVITIPFICVCEHESYKQWYTTGESTFDFCNFWDLTSRFNGDWIAEDLSDQWESFATGTDSGEYFGSRGAAASALILRSLSLNSDFWSYSSEDDLEELGHESLMYIS